MQVKLTLALPRDQLSVPVVRRILKASLETLGVLPDTIGDIEVALTEACSNVLNHADGEDEYEVSCGIDGTVCLIAVLDRGVGFDASGRGLDEQTLTAENGRGIQLMRALVDNVRFESRGGEAAGTVVHLEKQLDWHDGAVIARLGRSPMTHGPWGRDDHREDAPRPT
jgi:serine/threonine-protein kinase RsbW